MAKHNAEKSCQNLRPLAEKADLLVSYAPSLTFPALPISDREQFRIELAKLIQRRDRIHESTCNDINHTAADIANRRTSTGKYNKYEQAIIFVGGAGLSTSIEEEGKSISQFLKLLDHPQKVNKTSSKAPFNLDELNCYWNDLVIQPALQVEFELRAYARELHRGMHQEK